MPYRILIVEDSPAEADALRMHLSRYAAEKDLTFSVTVLSSAVEFVNGPHPADLIFMDIDLPGINGMEAAQILRGYDEQTPLVFVTNLAQYAVQGYQVDALDFMVKPVTYDDFALRMGRAMRMVRRASQQTLAIPTSDGVRVVRLADILYVDITKHDLHYHLVGEDHPLRMRGTITRLASELGEREFIKIAASCVINAAQVSRIRPASVELSDGTELFYSRSQRKAALEQLTTYLGRGA